MNVRFVVVRPESKRQTFPVRLPLLVGRSEEAKFRIQQDRVSRRHCEFFEQDGVVFLRDLGSTNGTLLNGESVETSVKIPLESGAVVQVGSLEFRIEYDTSASTTAQRSSEFDGGITDITVGMAQAADSESLQIEHAAEEPVVAEPPKPVDDDQLGDFLKGL